ncbi:MAG: geranylgeranylglycerol-phosphate geranylgeranyltransferase [Salibacteraceae bacterium]
MNTLAAFFKAIRFPNLLIIALTQYLLRWCLLSGFAMDFHGLQHLGMSELDFFLLVLSTVMIAAAGYIINDYFDLKIDRVNKPDKIIVGRAIKRRVAMAAHVVINIVGLLLAAYVAWKVNRFGLVTLHMLALLGLWQYSTNLKGTFFWGNFVIALLAALVPLIVGLYEVSLLNAIVNQQLIEEGKDPSLFDFNFLSYWIIGFAAFAFILTLARELTKDMADIEGDKQYGCETIPIRLGITNSKLILTGYYLLMVIGLIYVQQNFLSDKLTFAYMVIGLGLLLGITLYYTWTAKERKDFVKASTWNKWLSLGGVLYMPVAYYIIVQQAYEVSDFGSTIRYILGWTEGL